MNDGNTKELDYKSIRNKLNNNSSQNINRYNEDTVYNINNKPEHENSSNINTNDNIDEQLQESIKKLVKEQTNVARAEYYESDETQVSITQENDKLVKSNIDNKFQQQNKYSKIDRIDKYEKSDTFNKTQNIDVSDKSEKINKTINKPTQQNNSYQNRSKTVSDTKKNTNVSNKAQPNKSNNKSKKNIVLLFAFIAVLLIAVVVAVVVNNNINNNNSYSYNYDKAKQLSQKGKYQEALEYFNKAYNTKEGNNSIELMMAMYECYKEYGVKGDAISMLNKVLDVDGNNEQALNNLLEYYNDNEDGESINNLIEKHKNYETKDIFSKYQPDTPQASIASGKYYESLELELLSDSTDIYYTMDGSSPSLDSTRYNDTIMLDKGNSVVKCISVNDIGVYSDIAEYNYEIEFKQPDVPEIALASGTYAMGQNVEIQNIPEGCTVYYTLDGTYPNTSSYVYSEPISLPEGNIILSAISVDTHDLVSSVIKRNYIIQPEKKYSFEEAKQILRTRMEQMGIVKQNLDMTNDGASFTFVYQSKLNIDGIDIYYIRMDVKKDNHTTTQGYYGVGVKNGICYTVSNNDEGYVIEEF